MHDFDFDSLMQQPQEKPIESSINLIDDLASSSSSNNEKEYEEEDELNTSSSHNESDEYFVKKNPEISLNTDILQEERLLAGDYLITTSTANNIIDNTSDSISEAQMSPNANQLGINSSKATSSVSSSTSISSNSESTGLVEEQIITIPTITTITTQCNENDEESQQELPDLMHVTQESPSPTSFDNTSNNSSIETNNTRFAFFRMNFDLFEKKHFF